MKPKATILLDSISPTGDRLITSELTYNRFVHSEFMTHRLISKNSASSRAIPFKKMVEAVTENPALPFYWGREQKGMASGGELPTELACLCSEDWLRARDRAVEIATEMHERGLHKSICNRLLEPFAHMTVIATATERALKHFFALRAHPDAQPEIQALAYVWLEKVMASKPREINFGDWHVPYGDRMPEGLSMPAQLIVSVARCARVSYLTHDGELDVAKDGELCKKLTAGDPPHASPLEHPACCMRDRLPEHKTGNFGPYWLQYRKSLPNEMTKQLDYAARLATKPLWLKIWS